MILGGLVDLLILVGMIWTSALFISTGCLLSMPISILSDMLIHNYLLPLPAFGGMLFVVLGFLLLSLSDILIDLRDKKKFYEMPHSLWRTSLLFLSEYWSFASPPMRSPQITPPFNSVN